MKASIVISLSLFEILVGLGMAQATGSANCTKNCRDFQRECVKAHSQQACRIDYEVCIKHCKEK